MMEGRKIYILWTVGLTPLISFIPETTHPNKVSQEEYGKCEMSRSVQGTVHDAGQCSIPC